MFRAILWSQWKWSWKIVILAALVAFILPVQSVTSIRDPLTSEVNVQALLGRGDSISTLYALLAAGIGLLLGMSAWASDTRGRHVYALSLPIARWRYVLLRFAAGGVLLIIPAMAMGAGAIAAVHSVAVPAGLHTYALAVSLRFAVASLVAFAMFFSISSATPRTAAILLGAMALVIAGDVVTAAMGLNWNLAGRATAALMSWPGVFEVFAGRWLLINV